MPDAYRVARFRLQTLRLGHALLLQRLGSPFGERPTSQLSALSSQLGDVALAVWICGRSPDSALSRLQRTRSPRDLGWVAWRVNRYGLEKAEGELIAYLQAHWPEMSWWKQQQVPTRQLGADFMHRLVLTQRRMGLTLEDAMNVPLGVALWDLAAVAEENGAVSLVSDRDRALQAHYEAMLAAGELPAPGTVIRRN
ncbi:MAG: hypothetical protein J0M24_13780 [Verrucomicrobia bacterium]|nr:hypothetical protein [Verrucomicrobiota bacterium]